MSYTYGHEAAEKKTFVYPTSPFMKKLISQGYSPSKARKLVRYGKKMSAKQQQGHKKMRSAFAKSSPLPKTAPYKSNYLPDLSVKKPGKYGIDY